MEALDMAPDAVNEITNQTVKFIPIDQIDATFKSDSIGRAHDHRICICIV